MTEKAVVYAKYKYAKIAPKKVAVVLDLVRGKPVLEAQRILLFDRTKAAKITLGVLRTAIANAVTNRNLKAEDLYILDLRVDGGPSLKRGRIVAKSRSSPILKRTSHITVGLTPKASARPLEKVRESAKAKKVEGEKEAVKAGPAETKVKKPARVRQKLSTSKEKK